MLLVYVVLGIGWQDASQGKIASTSARDINPQQTQHVIPPTAPVRSPAVTAPASQPEKAPQEAHWFLKPEWMIVWVTVLYTITAWLTLIAIKRQARTMETQVKDAREAASAADGTTKATLTAIEKQAKEMSRQNRNMISRERARIAVRILPIDTLDFNDGTFIRLQLENIGPTHALNVRTKGDVRPVIEGVDPPETEPDELLYGTADIYGTGDSSIPGVQSILRANSPPSEGRLVLLFPEEWATGIEENDPTITIEVWGSIQYDDVFGQSHSTKFRYLMNLIKTRNLPNDKPFEPHPFTRWRMSHNPEDNHAD